MGASFAFYIFTFRWIVLVEIRWYLYERAEALERGQSILDREWALFHRNPEQALESDSNNPEQVSESENMNNPPVPWSHFQALTLEEDQRLQIYLRNYREVRLRYYRS